MKTHIIAIFLLLPTYLFANFIQIKRCNIDSTCGDTTKIATIDVTTQNLLEDKLNIYINNKIYMLPLLYKENRGINDFGVIFQNDSMMASFSIYQKQLSGMLQVEGTHYSIERDSTNKLCLSKLEMCSILDPNEALELPQYTNENSQIYDAPYDTIIRVAVFYTSDINSSFKYNIVSHVNQAILYSNTSFINSNINAKLELVYLGETSYTSIDFYSDLEYFTLKNDGYMNNVHYIRESYAADVCVLLTASTEYCGLGWLYANNDYAFCAVQAKTSCFNQYSFVHEIGHIVGCNHDAYVKPNVSPTYSHGYIYLDGKNSWRTIMAYSNLCQDNNCSCPRILQWSNPNIMYHGIATGDELSNNARVWNERISTVSNFYHCPFKLLLTDTLLNKVNYSYIRATDTIGTSGTCIISSGTQVKMHTSKNIILKPGFHAKAGCNLHIAIKNNIECNDTQNISYIQEHNTSESTKEQWCNQWNIIAHGYFPDEPFYKAGTNIYLLEEDTLINDKIYSSLVKYNSRDISETKSYIGALRFTEDKKVFFYYDNSDYLLYDFDVQIGDTLDIFSGIRNYMDTKTYRHIITNIDTLTNGKLKISSVAIVDDFYEKTWIEGIGSTDGIVHNRATGRDGGITTRLLCAYRHDECLYRTDIPNYIPLGCIYNEGDVITTTEKVETPKPLVQKIIRNGEIFIIRDGKTYNIMGIEIEE